VSAQWSKGAKFDAAVRAAFVEVLGKSHRRRVHRIRVVIAYRVGPFFWPAWYIAPQWKRDQWHKIACELDIDDCPTCQRYYWGS